MHNPIDRVAHTMTDGIKPFMSYSYGPLGKNSPWRSGCRLRVFQPGIIINALRKVPKHEIIVLNVMTYISGADGLRCYTCTSIDNSYCEKPWDHGNQIQTSVCSSGEAYCGVSNFPNIGNYFFKHS